MSEIKSYAANSQLVYSNVYPKKKTNPSDLTPSGWLSRVGPAGLRTDREEMIRWIILERGQAAGWLRDRLGSLKPKTIKPFKAIYFDGIRWAQLGSNQRPPDYEFPFVDLLSALKKLGFLIYLHHLQGFM